MATCCPFCILEFHGIFNFIDPNVSFQTCNLRHGLRTHFHHDQAWWRPPWNCRWDHQAFWEQRLQTCGHEVHAGTTVIYLRSLLLSFPRSGLRWAPWEALCWPFQEAFLCWAREVHGQRPRGRHGLGGAQRSEDWSCDAWWNKPCWLQARNYQGRLCSPGIEPF